ncbi:hypothetical protein GQ600_2504 [Phytophthora cactorum]|nr:hypothetical protein GQ600_2504 [Phytophthora cactorum]
MAIEVRWREFEHAVAKWRETMKGANTQTWESTCSDDSTRLERIVESFLRLETSEGPAPIEVLRSMETQKELDIRLRYEFERRFGDQLSLRISHERRHVLERLEYCAQQRLKTSRSDRNAHVKACLVLRLHSFEAAVESRLRPAWNLCRCVVRNGFGRTSCSAGGAKAQVQTLENKLEAAAKRAESQRVSFVRAELAQQEKDLLLAELTSRYRQLRSAQVAQQQEQLQHRQPIERKPLTVYGIPQPMRKPNDKRVEEVEEHVRSVLKSALMQSDVENQLEDTVGSDGVSCLSTAPVIDTILTNFVTFLILCSSGSRNPSPPSSPEVKI